MQMRVLTLILVLGSFTASSQDKPAGADSLLNSFNDTVQVSKDDVTSQAPPIMEKKWNQVRTKWVNINFGLAILLDHNIVNQDDPNVAQVGEIRPGTEFRGDRFLASGTINFKSPWRYMIAANFNGLDAPQGKKSFEFVDWNIEIPISKKAGWITLGKQKEGVGIEYVAPSTPLQFMERGTGAPMFIKQRNIGIRYSNNFLNQRMAFTFGLFNGFSGEATQITSRVTGLVHYKSDRDLVQVGMGYRHTGATDGKLTYKAKPEVNTAPSFINTGSFDASGGSLLMLEGVAAKGPALLIAEYFTNKVNLPNGDDLHFSYWQIGGGYFITGENRRFNKTTGNPGKVIPKKNFKFRKGSGPGAWEIATRFTSTDGTDAGITGGEFRRFTIGLNWFTNAHFRYTINYGRGWLEKGGITGNTHMWQFRAQFEL